MSQILLSPVITEKSMFSTAKGKYVFEVDSETNKREIIKEMKKVYKVEAIRVNIVSMRAKSRRFRFRQQGKTAAWKKAIITLKKGQRIEGFEIKQEAPKKKAKNKV